MPHLDLGPRPNMVLEASQLDLVLEAPELALVVEAPQLDLLQKELVAKLGEIEGRVRTTGRAAPCRGVELAEKGEVSVASSATGGGGSGGSFGSGEEESRQKLRPRWRSWCLAAVAGVGSGAEEAAC
ncbi:hypothetical protein E2562_020200 [Oryza meyeriana var. granulata]|uniref:Uncharacterized protein n=1 Tax=Oryza meyeriana var. granulata TaxID=110450 RepID=A0A6G1BMK0_9ORYZ|nr:hypothetical protein E2562_020200 [Oryza meyeriana var. granulata]